MKPEPQALWKQKQSQIDFLWGHHQKESDMYQLGTKQKRQTVWMVQWARDTKNGLKHKNVNLSLILEVNEEEFV